MRARDLKRQKSLISGAVILSLGGLLSKALGALYRIPLTNLLGPEGIGLYHLVFPVYSLLLSASSSGVPTALSRLISERLSLNDYKGARCAFRVAYILIGGAGLALSLLLFFFADRVAQLQGTPLIAEGYRMIAPSVFFTSQISVIRGYFQGRMNMVPTALSQVVEQVAKILFTVGVAVNFLPDVAKAVSFSILAVTVSELAALLTLIFLYIIGKKKRKADLQSQGEKPGAFRFAALLLEASLPIAIGSAMLPLSGIIDSLLVINIMGRYYGGNVVGVYGLLNGPVNSIIGLPAIVTGAIAAAAVPAISSGKEANGKVGLALKLTFLIAMPCALGLLVFSQQVISLLYPTLSTEDAGLAALLLQVGSVSVPFLALLQTSVCVLVAARKGFLGTLNLFVGVLAKLALSFILLQIPSINIFGSAISAAACYLVVAALNLFVIMRHYKFEPSAHVALKPLLCSTVAIAFAFGAQKLFEVFLGQNLSLALSIALSLLVYAFACLKLEVLSGSEIGLLSLPRKVKGDDPTGV